LPAPVARTIYAGMRKVVTDGTARRLTTPAGEEVAAKTGTAQTTGNATDSWLTAIVNHRYIITIVIHTPPTDAAAVTAGSHIITALPTTPPPLNCP
jgi:cell division protein FtsI/penicillin-binding protein 2